MKRLITSICLSLVVLMATASTTWDLQGKSYAVDTVYHAVVGPGTTQTTLLLKGASSNLNVFYTTTDLDNEYVEVRQIKAGDKVAAGGYVSSMAKSKSSAGNLYFAGVNADFFSGSAPVGTTIVDGEYYKTNNGDWQSIGIDRAGVPYLGTPYSTMKAILPLSPDGVKISGLNRDRIENYMVLYTPRIGSTTGTNAYGAEVALVAVNSNQKVGVGATKMKVVGAPVSGVGNMAVPANGCVLSAHGSRTENIMALKDGDEVTIDISLSFDKGEALDIVQSAGGRPMILSNNEVLNTEGAIDHLVGLHPRTAVGHNADKSKLVLLVVDGRSSISSGCTSKALANIMSYVGCTEAMNFDGGGSSTMYVEPLGVVNVPSDGKERAVTNGLYIVSTSPEDNNVAEIKFTEESKTLAKYGYYTPKFYGYNQYGVLIDTDVEGVELSIPAAIGTIQDNGSTLFCSGEGTDVLTATYNGVTATMPVTIGEGEVSFRLSDVIEDGYSGYKVEVFSAIDGESMPLDNQALTWWSDDTDIATVGAADGLVMGVANGSTTIHGKVGAFEGSLNVTVQKPSARVMPIDPDMDVTTWTVAQVGGKDRVVTPLGNGMKIDYTGASGRACYIRLTKEIKLWSVPDTLRLRVNPGDAPINSVTYSLTTGDGSISTYVFDVAVSKNQMNTLDLPIDYLCDANDRSNFPISIRQIQFSMGTVTTGAAYSIEIPGIECVYDVMPAGVGGVLADKVVSTLSPNPIKAGEAATLTSAQRGELAVAIYSESGVKVDAYEIEKTEDSVALPTANLAAGIYFVAITSDKDQSVAKLMVK